MNHMENVQDKTYKLPIRVKSVALNPTEKLFLVNDALPVL